MLKNLLTILSLACLATSCGPLRPTASRQLGVADSASMRSSGSIEFINTISIKPDAHQEKTGGSLVSTDPTGSMGNNTNHTDFYPGTNGPIENYSDLQFKYAILENSTVEELNNQRLLSFMEYWYGTHYRYGGTTREGIDCSAFAFLLMSSVYGVASLPRMAKDQYTACKKIHRDELREGDLVFFHTLGKRRAVTHVGVYLRNNKFIHASVSGVMISDMNDGYYDKHFIGAGRVLDPSVAVKSLNSAGSATGL